MWLPDVTRRGEIQFYFAKSLPYNMRLAIAIILIAIGLGMQVALPPENLLGNFWFGLPALFVGVLLLLVKGYSDKTTYQKNIEEWRPVERVQVERILEIQKKAKKWDQAAIDITNWLGCLSLIGLCVGAFVAALLIGAFNSDLIIVVLIDIGILFFPFWVTGTKSILIHDQLTIKADIFIKLHQRFETMKKDGEEFQFQMQTKKDATGKAEAPQDIKAIVLFRNGPPEFLGMQMQISINSVQGASYPYFYSVLVAKSEFGKLGKLNVSGIPKKVIYEPSSKNDVEIAVIRQYTTKTSGYHTKEDTIFKIFDFALDTSRNTIGDGK